MFSASAAVGATRELLAARASEAEKLGKIHAYLHGQQPAPINVIGAPQEVKDLAGMSRVNIARLPVDVLAQSLFVDGFHQPTIEGNEPVWGAWQANRMDARQTGIFRAALGYGASYAVVMPGESDMPVIRGLSPRFMTAMYGEDPDWPVMALETRLDGTWRLYDNEAVYFLKPGEPVPGVDDTPVDFISAAAHGLGDCPVVRFLNVDDLDGVPCGEVEPLFPLQDQIDWVTFDLMVAQHYAAFRQRYIMGWIPDSELQKLPTGANRYLTFEDEAIKVGEFSQTDTSSFLEAREASIRHMAIISQVAPHDLLGQMVNLSADALAAAEQSKIRKITERQTSFGESMEQTFQLVGRSMGAPVADDAEVRWRDPEARSLAQTADALVKLQQVGVPVEMLLEMIPKLTQSGIERAKALINRNGAFGDLQNILAEAVPPPVVEPAAA